MSVRITEVKAAAPAYREITLSTSAVSAQSRRAVKQFNDQFAETEIKVVCNGKGATVRLYEVDMAKMRRTARDAAAKCGLPADNILSDVQKAVASIKSYGIRNGRRAFAGYNDERKVQGRAEKEKTRGKLGYARADFDRADNLFPSNLENKIVCGDGAKTLRQLPDNCVDLVFTSPPYNFGLDYKKGSDQQKWERYFDKLFAVFEECARVVKFGGRVVINVQPLYSDYMPSHHVISNFFLQRGLIWRGEILWEKNNYNCKYTAWGSWKSPGNPYLKYSWEFVEVFCKGGLKKEGARENADITADEFKKWVYGKWSIAPERAMAEKYGHPAMFPEELARRVLKLFSFRGDMVVDPFMGAGTVAAVAKKANRRFMGVDISKEYCEIARRRVREILL